MKVGDTVYEVSFTILDEIVDDKIYDGIITELMAIDSKILTASHPIGTNVINVSAKWNKIELGENLERIGKIPNVKCVTGMKKIRTVIRSVADHVEVCDADTVLWTLEKDPVGEVMRAKNSRGYFKGITYSCTMFEYFGKQVLIWHFDHEGTPLGSKKIGGLSLESVIYLLYTHKIINEPIYTKILKVKSLRNRFIHDDKFIKISSDDAQEADMLLNDALDCIQYIKSAYEKMIT